MPHGTPDWHAWDTSQLLYKSIDPAEAAVRLGAVPSVDRMGQVLAHDNFSDGFADWTGYVYTPTHQITLMAARARSAGYCVRLWWNDAGDPTGLIHTMRDFPIPYRVGIEGHFHPKMIQGGYFISGYIWSATEWHLVGIQWRWTGVGLYEVAIERPAGIWVPVLNVNYTYGFPRTWRCLKVVIDMRTHMYVRGWWGSIPIPIVNQAMSYGNSIVEPHIDMNVAAWGDKDYAGECWIDDFIVTAYEP